MWKRQTISVACLPCLVLKTQKEPAFIKLGEKDFVRRRWSHLEFLVQAIQGTRLFIAALTFGVILFCSGSCFCPYFNALQIVPYKCRLRIYIEVKLFSAVQLSMCLVNGCSICSSIQND